MLICCCLTSLCIQMTSGSEGTTGCLRDIMSLEGAPASTISSLGHPVCTVWCSCLSRGSSGLPDCATLLPSSVLLLLAGKCQSQPEPKAKHVVPLPPSGTYLAVREHGHDHSISFCPCLHPVTALPSAACTRVSAGSNNDLQQLLCLAALGRWCHSRSYNTLSVSCLVVAVLEEYKLL